MTWQAISARPYHEDGGGAVNENDEILAQLRQWKIEMASSFPRYHSQEEADGEGGGAGGGAEMVPQPPPPGGGRGGGSGGRPRKNVSGGGGSGGGLGAEPGAGTVLSSLNPTPRAATETSSGGVDRLVLSG